MRLLFVVFCMLIIPITTKAEVPQSQAQIQLSFSPIVKKVSPAIVNIFAEKTVQTQARGFSPFANDPLFRQFFGDSMMGRQFQDRAAKTLGSGFIVDPTGLVVTNAHVVKGGSNITVDLADGRQFEAEISLIDEPSDIALLRLKTKGEKLPFIAFEPSETVEVGDLVLAVGNPFGVGQTVTSGIVSAVSRSTSDITDYNFFIQTDAAINPGNSGGPLVSMNGNVIGVNTAIFSRSGGSLGIGFAIPSEMALTVIAAEKNGQTNDHGVMRAWVGAKGQDLTPELAQSLNIDRVSGVLIADVHPKSPAKEAGLKQGDIVTSINDKPVKDAQELLFRFATLPLNTEVKLNYLRNGSARIAKFKTATPPEFPLRDAITLKGQHFLNGAEIVNVSPAVEVEYGLKNQSEGVIISKPATKTGFSIFNVQAGDGIIAVNGQKITNTKQLQKLMSQNNGKWQIVLRRNGQDQTILIR